MIKYNVKVRDLAGCEYVKYNLDEFEIMSLKDQGYEILEQYQAL